MSRTTLARAARATKSGIRRYPKELAATFRPPHPGIWHDRLTADLEPFYSNEPSLAAMWIGHATVLLRVGTTTLLTDPVFAERIGVKFGPVTVGLTRVSPPPVDLHHLPPVDAILISHAHFDHLDRPTLNRLANPRTTVITARRTRRLVPDGFRRVVEVDWSSSFNFQSLRIIAIKPAHWGARKAYDRRRGFNSYLIEHVDSARRVLFAGDTAVTRAFDTIDNIDLAIFGIGAYDPWDHAHANPEQVWRMFSRMGAQRLLPMHHSTFDLGEESLDEPMQRLVGAAGAQRDRIVASRMGEVWAGAAGAELTC